MFQANPTAHVGPTGAHRWFRAPIDVANLDRTDAVQELLIAMPAEVLQEQQKLNPDKPPSLRGQRLKTHDHGIRPDGLLAEIENLTDQLKHKLLCFEMLRAVQLSGQPMLPDDEAAQTSVQVALDDIAATARGIEIASHDIFLRAMSAREPCTRQEE